MCQATTAEGVVVVVGGVEVNAVGDAVMTDGELTSVEGKSDALMAVVSLVVVGGGGISEAPILRFLPLGAGSRGGDRLYVTVLVTTDRTLTGLVHALLGVSKNRRVALSQFQSAGEKGE
jgi:hypothetical protein